MDLAGTSSSYITPTAALKTAAITRRILLARHMGVNKVDLDTLAIDDPYEAVALDVAALKANPNLPGDLLLTGIVYDVATGLVRTAVPSAPVRKQSGP